MLIDNALRFENVVKNTRNKGIVTWDNSKELELYVS